MERAHQPTTANGILEFINLYKLLVNIKFINKDLFFE